VIRGFHIVVDYYSLVRYDAVFVVICYQRVGESYCFCLQSTNQHGTAAYLRTLQLRLVSCL
jgi:hypothetical protein